MGGYAEIFDPWFSKHFLAWSINSTTAITFRWSFISFWTNSFMLGSRKWCHYLLLASKYHAPSQPLAKGYFGLLKAYRKEECQGYLSKNPGRVVTRLQFSESLCYRYDNEEHHWWVQTTGVVPLNREAILPKSLPFEQMNALNPTLPKDTEIKFLPLHSPFPS